MNTSEAIEAVPDGDALLEFLENAWTYVSSDEGGYVPQPPWWSDAWPEDVRKSACKVLAEIQELVMEPVPGHFNICRVGTRYIVTMYVRRKEFASMAEAIEADRRDIEDLAAGIL